VKLNVCINTDLGGVAQSVVYNYKSAELILYLFSSINCDLSSLADSLSIIDYSFKVESSVAGTQTVDTQASVIPIPSTMNGIVFKYKKKKRISFLSKIDV